MNSPPPPKTMFVCVYIVLVSQSQTAKQTKITLTSGENFQQIIQLNFGMYTKLSLQSSRESRLFQLILSRIVAADSTWKKNYFDTSIQTQRLEFH